VSTATIVWAAVAFVLFLVDLRLRVDWGLLAPPVWVSLVQALLWPATLPITLFAR
jgi:hypothetical protein